MTSMKSNPSLSGIPSPLKAASKYTAAATCCMRSNQAVSKYGESLNVVLTEFYLACYPAWRNTCPCLNFWSSHQWTWVPVKLATPCISIIQVVCELY
jgi:hypothetical protein